MRHVKSYVSHLVTIIEVGSHTIFSRVVVHNLQRTPESILEYDFSNVVEGRELVKQYIKSEDTNAS